MRAHHRAAIAIIVAIIFSGRSGHLLAQESALHPIHLAATVGGGPVSSSGEFIYGPHTRFSRGSGRGYGVSMGGDIALREGGGLCLEGLVGYWSGYLEGKYYSRVSMVLTTTIGAQRLPVDYLYAAHADFSYLTASISAKYYPFSWLYLGAGSIFGGSPAASRP